MFKIRKALGRELKQVDSIYLADDPFFLVGLVKEFLHA